MPPLPLELLGFAALNIPNIRVYDGRCTRDERRLSRDWMNYFGWYPERSSSFHQNGMDCPGMNQGANSEDLWYTNRHKPVHRAKRDEMTKGALRSMLVASRGILTTRTTATHRLVARVGQAYIPLSRSPQHTNAPGDKKWLERVAQILCGVLCVHDCTKPRDGS